MNARAPTNTPTQESQTTNMRQSQALTTQKTGSATLIEQKKYNTSGTKYPIAKRETTTKLHDA